LAVRKIHHITETLLADLVKVIASSLLNKVLVVLTSSKEKKYSARNVLALPTLVSLFHSFG
jgi:hypothetical protein